MPQHTADTTDARDEASELAELRQRILALQDDFAGADRHLRAAVRDRPLLALALAVAVGFIFGRTVRSL